MRTDAEALRRLSRFHEERRGKWQIKHRREGEVDVMIYAGDYYVGTAEPFDAQRICDAMNVIPAALACLAATETALRDLVELPQDPDEMLAAWETARAVVGDALNALAAAGQPVAASMGRDALAELHPVLVSEAAAEETRDG